MKVVLIASCYNTISRKILSNKQINLVGIAIAKNDSRVSRKQKLKQMVFSFLFRYIIRKTKIFTPLSAFEFQKNSQAALCEWLGKTKPDLILVCSSPFLFDKEVIQIPSYGVVNVHLAILPKYRGPNPLFWQYHDFDLNPGATIHYLDEKEDTGDIILQESFDIEIGMPYSKTFKKCEELGYKLVVKVMKDMQAGIVSRVRQDKKSTTIRARRLRKEDVKDLIKWNDWPVERVFHFIKGTSLYDALPDHAELRATSDLIFESYSTNELLNVEPGQLIQNGDHYKLACSNGSITIKKQKAGILKNVKVNFWFNRNLLSNAKLLMSLVIFKN